MLRKIVFWLHLTLGLAASLAVAVMCLTGAALAFEKDLIAWAERDARTVQPATANQPRLPLEDVLQRVSAARPDLRVNSIAIARDPRTALALNLPGNAVIHANPYTGEVREAHAPRMRAFMRTMIAWHIRLNFAPGPENLGRKLNSAANLILVFLGISGLVLWWPRIWSARVLRPSLWFVRGARGRARDWNWHNVIGFWTLPVLIVLAASGVVLSYRWAGDLVFRLAGESPPSAAGNTPRPPAPPSPASVTALPSAPPQNARAGSPTLTTLVAAVQQTFPTWDLLTVRFSPPLRGTPVLNDTVVVAVRSSGSPPFAQSTLTLDTKTGSVLRTEAFADLSDGTRARRWLRFLHTGEAFRAPGQLVAGVACLGGLLLVWTGSALAWRRFFGRTVQLDPSAPAPALSEP